MIRVKRGVVVTDFHLLYYVMTRVPVPNLYYG